MLQPKIIKVLIVGLGPVGRLILLSLIKDGRFKLLPFIFENKGKFTSGIAGEGKYTFTFILSDYESTLKQMINDNGSFIILDSLDPDNCESRAELYYKLNLPFIMMARNPVILQLAKSVKINNYSAMEILPADAGLDTWYKAIEYFIKADWQETLQNHQPG